MWKSLIFGLVCILSVPFAIAQNEDHVMGGKFSKHIEYNLIWPLLSSKDDLEKLFFGDFNAPLEFFYEHSSNGTLSAFRVVRDTLINFYMLESKCVSNYKEAVAVAHNKYPWPASGYQTNKDSIDLINKQHKERLKKFDEELAKLSKVESRTIAVSDLFAEKLYEKTVSVIDNFKARGYPLTMTGGFWVTFRNIVDDEMWSLKIQEPRGNTLKLAKICIKILEESTDTGQLNESMYIQLLDDF